MTNRRSSNLAAVPDSPQPPGAAAPAPAPIDTPARQRLHEARTALKTAIADRDRRAVRLAELADRHARGEQQRQAAETDLATARAAGDAQTARGARERIEDIQVQLVPINVELERLRSEAAIADRAAQCAAVAVRQAKDGILAGDCWRDARAAVASAREVLRNALERLLSISLTLDARAFDRLRSSNGYEMGMDAERIRRELRESIASVEALTNTGIAVGRIDELTARVEAELERLITTEE